MIKGEEERRGFYLDGETVWLTLTELQGRLSGTPTKHLLATWENGAKKEAEGKMKCFLYPNIKCEPGKNPISLCYECNRIKKEAEG